MSTISQASLTPIALQALNLKFAALLEQKYAAYSGSRYFSVESEIASPMLFVTVVIKNSDESFYYPISAKIDFLRQQLSEMTAYEALIGFIDAYLEEFFHEGEQVFLPIDWSQFDVEGFAIVVKGQIFNRKLESMADQWLEQHGK